MDQTALPRPYFSAITIACIAFVAFAGITNADEPHAPKARTTGDPDIPVAHLQIMLQPLRQDQLAIEAEAWMTLLEQKIQQIAETDLALRQATEASGEASAEDDAAETDTASPAATGTGAEVAAAALEERKQALSDQLVELRSQRSALIDRCNVVLDEWEAKGGDPATQRQYISAVTGVKAADLDTDVLWSTISGWITSDEGGWRWGTNIVLFFITLIITWIVAKIAAKATARALRLVKNLTALLRAFIVKTVSGAVLLVGLIIALSMLEVNIGPLVAMIGGIAFVVAFALQGTLSNLASGILILVYRPFDVDDVVEVAGVSGVVENMTLVTTSIRTFDNRAVVVPNNSIWGNVITNITGKDTRRVDMVFGISYTDDMRKASDILMDLIKNHELVLENPEPMVKVHELGDSSVNLICRPWVKTPDYWTVYWDVTRAAKERFDAEGITIPFPQRDVHVFQEA